PPGDVHPRRRQQHPDGGSALVSRRRRLDPHTVLGKYSAAGVLLDRDRSVADDRARCGDHVDGRLAQRARRRTTRRTRPARSDEDTRVLRMMRFLMRRFVGLAVVLFAISILVFTIFNVIPGGDPALRLAGRRPTAENIQQIRRTWGFDKPLPVQYIDLMKKLFGGRDFISYQNQTAVLPTTEHGIPRTFSVAIGAA